MEQSAMQAVQSKKGERFPMSEYGAALLIDVDGNDMTQLESEAQKIGEICLENGAADVIIAGETSKQNTIWAMRRSVSEAVKSLSVYKEEDTVVPRARLPELMQLIKRVCDKYNLKAISYGHIGDGNIHVNILKMNLSDEEWGSRIDPAVTELFKGTVAMGGSISGEHGIGYVQKNYMPLALSNVELTLMRQIKKVFDPYNILNPGKIFPDNLS
jgi:glycolate oxidase